MLFAVSIPLKISSLGIILLIVGTLMILMSVLPMMRDETSSFKQRLYGGMAGGVLDVVGIILLLI